MSLLVGRLHRMSTHALCLLLILTSVVVQWTTELAQVARIQPDSALHTRHSRCFRSPHIITSEDKTPVTDTCVCVGI